MFIDFVWENLGNLIQLLIVENDMLAERVCFTACQLYYILFKLFMSHLM